MFFLPLDFIVKKSLLWHSRIFEISPIIVVPVIAVSCCPSGFVRNIPLSWQIIIYETFLYVFSFFIAINYATVNILLHLLCLIRYISMTGFLYFKTISTFIVLIIYYKSRLERGRNLESTYPGVGGILKLCLEKRRCINCIDLLKTGYCKEIFKNLAPEVSIWGFTTSWFFFFFGKIHIT